MCIGLHSKYQLFLFNETLNFLDRFSKNIQIPNFMKIHPVGAELFHADRHDESNSRCSQFRERALNKSLGATIELAAVNQYGSPAEFLEQKTPIARGNLKLAPLLKYGEYAVRKRPLLRERPRYRSSMKTDRHSPRPCFTY
jgi:hypothetical protein